MENDIPPTWARNGAPRGPRPGTAQTLRCRSLTLRRISWQDLDDEGRIADLPEGAGPCSALVLPDVEGPAVLEEGSERPVTSPLFAVDGRGRPGEIGPGVGTVVWFPRNAIRELAGHDIALPDRIPETMLTRTFRSLLGAVVEGLRESTPAPVSMYILERLLLEGMWGLVIEATDVVQRTAPHRTLFERAQHLIRVNATDPRYTVATLATELGVSERHLQRAFSGRDVTPRGFLRRVRVELALTMLRDPDYDSLTLDQIGQHSGFTDATAMRGGFARENLSTPRRLRRDRAA
ncbi:AraC-like DNA-binding protein [Microbacterium resistens]|uniref:AraC-like DNA-binding protein n=1 Tax=Microbacterium resistens TaxID=156977 RepID=A0ABU1SBM6_9MICO|nr:AraC family transcriptional regulator [Microbacterium resistens]MDR6866998.1 AraC-like DNA-binding protein [Microbacterium resistens]